MVFSEAERIDAEGRELDTNLRTLIGFDHYAKTQVRCGRALQVFSRKLVATGCTTLLRATLKEVCLPIAPPLTHNY